MLTVAALAIVSFLTVLDLRRTRLGTLSKIGENTARHIIMPSLTDLTPAVLARNQDTIQNIRLWDTRPSLQTYQQTQAIRLYYNFYDVDTDRYHLPDGYHEVMLSTRELAPKLPVQAQTWVNKI